jgi:di/tricarboxylate transporter
MTISQWIIFGTLAGSLVLFVLDFWRYDIVALLALLIVTLAGLVPLENAFSGFSNPAVVTVAAVLVISRGLQNSGFVEVIGRQLARLKGGALTQLAALTLLVTVLSAFMNNVGALALLLPVAIQIARKKGVSPSMFLMPIAFAAHFGGNFTLIGTPTNLIVSAFREQTLARPFAMFDFAPVGVGIAVPGLLFIILVGWRLIPTRRGQTAQNDMFEIERYATELRIPSGSKLEGRRLSEIRQFIEAEIIISGLVRGEERRMAPSPQTKFRADDVLILQIDTENLDQLIATAGLELVGSKQFEQADLDSDEVTLMEAVITANSLMVGSTARGLNLRKRFGVNLLAIARQGRRLRTRLDRIRFRVGDVLLLQTHSETLKDVLSSLGCLPLIERGLRIGQPRRTILAVAIFVTAMVLSAAGLVAVQISFSVAAVLMVMLKLLSLGEAYESIDWPVIFLLGAMIPVGQALETTGGAQLLADLLLRVGSQLPPAIILAILLVALMFLSDLVNNAAAVVLMTPIAINIALGLGVSVDPFLMAMAVGSSCAFLTPIGHQSNALVMGPGGYKFGDFWRLGLPLEIIIAASAIPLILYFWPLG